MINISDNKTKPVTITASQTIVGLQMGFSGYYLPDIYNDYN